MSAKVVVLGGKELKQSLEKYPPAVRRHVYAAMLAGARAIQAKAQQLIEESPASGAWYHDSSKVPAHHQASAPGEPPASWTEQLHDGIEVKEDQANNTVYVASTARSPEGVDYGLILELGCSTIKKRPFMYPAFREIVPNLRTTIKAALKAANPKKKG